MFIEQSDYGNDIMSKPFEMSHIYGMFLNWQSFFFSLNRSINIEYDKMIYIYSERVKFLVLETLK